MCVTLQVSVFIAQCTTYLSIERMGLGIYRDICLCRACVSCLGLLCFFPFRYGFNAYFYTLKCRFSCGLCELCAAEVLYDSCVRTGYTSVQFSFCLFTFGVCKWIRLKWISELFADLFRNRNSNSIRNNLSNLKHLTKTAKYTHMLHSAHNASNKNTKTLIQGTLYLISVSWSIEWWDQTNCVFYRYNNLKSTWT